MKRRFAYLHHKVTTINQITTKFVAIAIAITYYLLEELFKKAVYFSPSTSDVLHEGQTFFWSYLRNGSCD